MEKMLEQTPLFLDRRWALRTFVLYLREDESKKKKMKEGALQRCSQLKTVSFGDGSCGNAENTVLQMQCCWYIESVQSDRLIAAL